MGLNLFVECAVLSVLLVCQGGMYIDSLLPRLHRVIITLYLSRYRSHYGPSCDSQLQTRTYHSQLTLASPEGGL